MENASRALAMAGGVLIAVIILGALMLMFSNLSSYQNQNDMTKEQAQAVEFNNQYLAFEKDDLTLMDLKSLYNKIESNNERNSNQRIENNIKDVFPKINEKFSDIEEQDKINLRFKCTIVSYNDEGKINKIQVEKVEK